PSGSSPPGRVAVAPTAAAGPPLPERSQAIMMQKLATICKRRRRRRGRAPLDRASWVPWSQVEWESWSRAAGSLAGGGVLGITPREVASLPLPSNVRGGLLRDRPPRGGLPA